MNTNLQPNDIFNYINVDIKDRELAEKVFKTALSFLLYLKPGDSLEVSHTKFTKLTDDMITINTTINPEEIVNSLEVSEIIRVMI